MKKLFILGGSILQLPAIKKAKNLGYEVAVADMNPAAIGRSHADAFYEVSTTDIDGIVQAASSFQPDGVMTLATDMPMRSIAAAATRLGLPGINWETALRATDKGEMRKALQAHQVPIPRFFIITSLEEQEEWLEKKGAVSLPCIIKPTDSSGSRGVVRVDEEEALSDAFQYSRSHSRTGTVIVEEYMRGPEVSVETIALNGEVFVLAVTDKMTTGAPHFVETGHSQPSRIKEEDLAKIKDLAAQAVKAIGIHSGPAHVEIILTAEGPKIVELGARMGGDNITTYLVPLSTGVDMLEAVIRLACGEDTAIQPRWRKGSAIRYIPAPAGKLKAVQGLESARELEGIQEAVLTKEIGSVLTEVHNSAERAGYVIAQAATAEEALAACERALACIHLEVE